MTAPRHTSAKSLAIGLWAVGGVLVLLGQAIARLLPRALEPILDGSLDLTAGLTYVASVFAFAYSEGYRGFQQRFSPRAVARASYLANNPRALHVVFAPLFTMGLFHATRRRLMGSWLLLIGVIGLIVLVSQLAQPWRGAVDAGVVVGLTWGALATVAMFVRRLRGHTLDVDPQLPDSRYLDPPQAA
jgi:hypothetical protein